MGQNPDSGLEIQPFYRIWIAGLEPDYLRLRRQNGDRASLQHIFGGDCSRVSRIHSVLESANFTDMNAGDQRLSTCIKACESVEEIVFLLMNH